MSTRLTNDLRDTIAHEILRHRFNEPVDAIIVERAALADAVYSDIYRKSDREKMEALPTGWLPENSSIGVQFGASGSRYEKLAFNGEFYGQLRAMMTKREGEDVNRRVLSKHAHGCAKVYEDAHKLAVRHSELATAYEALKEEFDAAKRQIKAALANVNTIKRLIEAWPEVEPFAAKHENAPRNLPSVPTQTLNKLLDLPVAA